MISRPSLRPARAGAPETCALLATLALSAGQVVGAIAQRLWGPAEPVHPSATVHSAVRWLRRVLGTDDLVLTRADGYLLDIAPERVDALHFDALVRAARGQDPVLALDTLREALALWHGDPLCGLDAEQLVDGAHAALTARCLDALVLRIDPELRRGQYETAIPELRGLTEQDPLRESAWHRLMVALNAIGRPAEALEYFNRIRDELRRSLGREPPPSCVSCTASPRRRSSWSARRTGTVCAIQAPRHHRRLRRPHRLTVHTGPPVGGDPTVPGR